MSLLEKKITPVSGDTPSLTAQDIENFKTELPEWDIMMVDDVPHLQRNFKFKNFAEALTFTNALGKIAEEQGHHPLIELTWGRVTVEWWTHDLHGLHQNDFIMAAKTDQIFKNRPS